MLGAKAVVDGCCRAVVELHGAASIGEDLAPKQLERGDHGFGEVAEVVEDLVDDRREVLGVVRQLVERLLLGERHRHRDRCDLLLLVADALTAEVVTLGVPCTEHGCGHRSTGVDDHAELVLVDRLAREQGLQLVAVGEFLVGAANKADDFFGLDECVKSLCHWSGSPYARTSNLARSAMPAASREPAPLCLGSFDL